MASGESIFRPVGMTRGPPVLRLRSVNPFQSMLRQTDCGFGHGGQAPRRRSMIIKWRDELTIDRGPIDQDHHTLIAIINRFETVTPGPDAGPKLEDILDSLEQY